MEQEERIQSYLSGSMSIEERQVFESDLTKNASLEKAFNEYKDIQAAFKNVEAKQLKERFKQLDQKSIPLYKKMFSNTYRNIAYSAVVVIALLLVFNTGTSNDSLYTSYFETYPNVYEPITRGAQEIESTMAFQLYENNNFKEAELEFAKLIVGKVNTNYQFYYALCLVENSKMDAALIEFEDLKTKNQDFLSEIYWYTALVHLHKDNTLKVKENLNALIELKSNFKQKEAEELLEAME